LKSKGTSDAKIELAVCQQAFTLTTVQKKAQLEQKLFKLIPADKLDAVKAQIRRVGKIVSDSNGAN
jgi:hypothetical protein